MSATNEADKAAYEAAIAKNEHYGKLNARFDIRANGLQMAGYTYTRIPALDIAVFTKTRHGKTHTIAAATVLNADEIVWADVVDSVLNFGAI